MKKVVVVLMMAALVAVAQAVLIEDFESYAEGTDPGTMGDGVTVVTDTGTNGTKVLQQDIVSGAGWTGAGIDWTDIYDNGTVIQFDAYLGSSYNGVVGISQWNGITYTNFNDFQAMIRHDGGAGTGIDYRDSGSYIDIDAGIADVDEWHTYVFVVNYTAQTYDIYVDGGLVAAGAGFRATGHDHSGSFRILGGYPGSDSSVMIDNVDVTVPEPATMALLGLGALVLRRRK